MEETVIDWNEEANAVIKDVKTHVKAIEVSQQLISNSFFTLLFLLNFFLLHPFFVIIIQHSL
jgi:hypothetical protein